MPELSLARTCEAVSRHLQYWVWRMFERLRPLAHSGLVAAIPCNYYGNYKNILVNTRTSLNSQQYYGPIYRRWMHATATNRNWSGWHACSRIVRVERLYTHCTGTNVTNLIEFIHVVCMTSWKYKARTRSYNYGISFIQSFLEKKLTDAFYPVNDFYLLSS
jgi:hypothetical protein